MTASVVSTSAEAVRYAIDAARPDGDAPDYWPDVDAACSDVIRLVLSGTATEDEMRTACHSANRAAEACQKAVDASGGAVRVIFDAPYSLEDARADRHRAARAACHAAAYATFPIPMSAVRSAVEAVSVKARSECSSGTWGAAQEIRRKAERQAYEYFLAPYV